MKNAEYQGNLSCPQRDSAEHEGYAGAQSVGRREGKEQGGADLLEKILSRENLNRAYKRVRANKGAPGIDGMTVEDAQPWLREHREELLETIRQGKYKPQPVRRKEIPKPDGGVRKLGIPTVVDRIIQQAIAQQLTPIYEPLFSDLSYGYRPGRSAQMAIQKVKEYAEKGYTQAVLVDLSKYFDTLNHELLMNLLRKNIQDKRAIELIKRYLKAGVMENGLLVKTEEGSPQGGPLSPLLANIYLNEYDQEMARRGVPVIRYADDIVVLAKSKRAAERLLETTQRYLEGKLKLRMNVEKSKVVSVFAIRNFKFLGFALGKVLEESQGQAERTDFPQSGQKCPGRDAEGKGLHPGLAGLLRDSKHENNNGQMGRVAAPQNPDVYLEAVEESTDESKEPDKIGDAPMAGIQEWKLSEGVLGSCRKRYSRAHNNEHETRSSRIF